MKSFLLCFIPLFIAVDAVGLLPVFFALTEGIERSKVKKIIIQSIITALIVALLFIALGEIILKILGITVADFMIAGGALLFSLSLYNLLIMDKNIKKVDPESLGAVPIGVPLIVGPAVLTTSLLLLHQHGYIATTLSIIVNLIIAGIFLWFAHSIMKILGKTGAKTISKLSDLLLAAIGIMLVRKGIISFL
jgi:multiple antibiotic resistance protein